MIRQELKSIKADYDNLLNQIAEANEGITTKGDKDFGKWLKTRYGNRSGFTYKSIKARVLSFKNLIQSPSEEVLKSHEEELDMYQAKLDTFKEVVSEYLEYKKNAPEHKLEKAWYVYHFYNKDNIDKEPTLARCNLIVRGIDRAVFKNVKLGNDYIGSYHKSTNNKTVYFNLNTEEEASSAISGAHIRVYFNDFETDEIMLGSYITYEGDKIVRGTVVLHSVNSKKMLPPKSLSFKKNLQELRDVPVTIRKFLSVNRYNQGVIRRDIFELDRLELFVQNNQFDKWESRFFEEDIPTLFIASPNRSLEEEGAKKNANFVKALIKKLNTRFNKKGKNKKINICEELELIPDDEDGAMPTSFSGLKTTRFFVLIYTKTIKGSLSLVELGYALGNCKSVLVFHEKEAISDRIRAIKKIDGVKVTSFSKLEGRMDRIFNDIVDEVEKNLKNYIDN